jgi:type I restriction enzyme S subunit
MSEVRNEYAEFLSAVPDRWSKVKMRDVGRIVSGGTPSRDAPSLWGGGIPWVTPGELTALPTKEIEKTAETISAAGLAGSGANLLPVNSLLITSRATLGARAVNTVPMATNQGFKSVVPFDRRLTDYLFHLTEKIKPEMVRRASGTTFLEISGSEFGDIVLPLPQADEATKIAEVLDTLDAAIRGTEAVVAKLRAMKQGLLHDLLTRGIDANGDLRPPQPEAPHLYHQTPLGWLPKEWDAPQIFEVGEVVTGRTPPAEDPSAWGEDTPFVTPGDIAHGQMVSRSERSLSESGKKYVPTVRAGATSVVCIGSTIGKVGYLARECAFNQQINAVVPSAGHVDAFIFSSICRSIGQLGRLAGLQAVPIVNKREFQKIRIAACSKTEQAEISLRLSVAEHREAAEVEQLKKLIAAKSGLMDDLLTGRVPATPLL